jgi:hypothetical protein
VWVDEIINNPFEIAGYIKENFLSNTCFSENRRYRERPSLTDRRRVESIAGRDDVHKRSFTDRRSIEFNNNVAEEYKVTLNLDYQNEVDNPQFTHFKIDEQTKCLFLNGMDVKSL